MTKFYSDMSWLLPMQSSDLDILSSSELNASSLVSLASKRFTDAQARKISKAIRNLPEIEGLNRINLAILTDANLEFCTDAIITTGLRYGLRVNILLVEYSDIYAQSTDGESDLYAFNPDIILYAGFGAAFNSLVAGFGDADNSRGLAADLVDQMLGEVRAVTGGIKQHCDAQILMQTVPSNHADLFGNVDRYQPNGFGYEVNRLNTGLVELGFPIIDTARLAERVGIYNWTDDAKYHWAKLPFSLSYASHYCDAIMRKIGLFYGRVKKCLVLDLDNTLWGGVIGDDGLDGIALGNNSPAGEAFLAGQRYYKMLANRGVVLAVCSKNEMSNALLPFEKHPDMVLKRDDIACFVANWNDKAGNIEQIAQSLNLGLDSFVFLDDNPMERDIVRTRLPQVSVPEVPNHDASVYPRIIEAGGYFETAGFSSADVVRVADYKANAQRAEIKSSSTDMDSYLQALQMTLTVEAFAPINEERIIQLINRSNQFNLTTHRYTNADFNSIIESDNSFGFTFRLLDKFVDSGLIAVIICKTIAHEECPAWEIDTWLMSCRVLGRKVELASLHQIALQGKEHGARYLIGRYIPSLKNKMVKNHYKNLGFELLTEDETGETTWKLDIDEWLESFDQTLPFEFST